MSEFVYYGILIALIFGVLAGIALMGRVEKAAKGNMLSALCTAAAILLALYWYDMLTTVSVWITLGVGLLVGLVGAHRVKMIQMPQTVALLNGFGGIASAFVAIVALYVGGVSNFEIVTAGLALCIGTLTLTGSLIAAGKLHNLMGQKPVVWPAHQLLTMGSVVLMLAALVAMLFVGIEQHAILFILVLLVLSGFFGIAFAIRVGGADMPITISLLNSLSGIAVSAAGMTVSDPLLVAVGAIIGAAGLILTQIMCKAMNRSLSSILMSKAPAATEKPKAAAVPEAETKAAPAVASAPNPQQLLADAKSVIIVPGYGMALAQAQGLVKQLSDKLEASGVDVKYAIHPVAGRMPGHMNVLLAEVDVPYDKLYEIDDINPQFANTDVVVVIGANDVVNPAAHTAVDTPIYGMPILDVENAKNIIICNYDVKPGYAGVPNPLYEDGESILMLGDAKESINKLLQAPQAETAAAEAAPVTGGGPNPQQVLADAKSVIIVPGYGMALAQAQGLVKQLSDKLEAKGIDVKYAIHPVAGRMPGHMNVLLAEVDVPYDKLHEIDDINPQFANTDVVVVIGANDVVNPAAHTAVDTPIYGMPILDVENAKNVIICNYDTNPGYAGVPNPLYEDGQAILMLGDAKESINKLLQEPQAAPAAEEAAPAASGPSPQQALADAKSVIIVPGYGMALAQAQGLVKQLADKLEASGVDVKFAIHPVAGRMPGHMNVLLAEVDVPYDKLYEIDDINPQFETCDTVIVIGANDVVNPAAYTAVDTPIYGMPILDVDKAKNIIICNYDLNPGYAGVPNPLYEDGQSILMLGDAKESIGKLL